MPVDRTRRELAAMHTEIVLKHDLPINAFESPDNNLEAVFKYLVHG